MTKYESAHLAKTTEAILSTLQYVPFFAPFKGREEVLAEFAGMMRHETILQNQELLREGDVGDTMYILHRGEVAVTRKTMEKEEYTLALLSSEGHAFFGELALLDNDRRTATVRTTQECEVLILTRSDFTTFCDKHPDIGVRVMRELSKILCSRFRDTNQDVILLFEALVEEVRSEI